MIPFPECLYQAVGGSFFTASSGYTNVHEKTQTKENGLSILTTTCNVHRVRMQDDANSFPGLDSRFKKAMRELPDEFKEEPFKKFFENYGSHVIFSIDYGARYVSQQFYSRTVEAEAKSATEKHRRAIFASWENSSEVSKEKRETSDKRKTSCWGKERASFKDDEESWKKAVQKEPSAIGYNKLKSIVEVLDSLNETQKKEIGLSKEKLQALLKAQATHYCQWAKKSDKIDPCAEVKSDNNGDSKGEVEKPRPPLRKKKANGEMEWLKVPANAARDSATFAKSQCGKDQGFTPMVGLYAKTEDLGSMFASQNIEMNLVCAPDEKYREAKGTHNQSKPSFAKSKERTYLERMHFWPYPERVSETTWYDVLSK